MSEQLKLAPDLAASPVIRLLSAATVNRIAAGEVIERPAAVVKELVENALDAGARRICVSLAEGGIGRIEVIDDGVGMTADDLALAVLRHATSKLHDGADADNLVGITTLGFRGEALPSIGAAARLAITSRSDAAGHASRILVEGGVVGEVVPAAGPVGTRVVVSDLFHATPARRKFLKHPRTEAEHAEAALRRLAMAAAGVAFRLDIDGRCVFDLPGQDRAGRVAALLGPEAAACLLPVAAERGGLVMTGFACQPAVSRATAIGQGLVVNGRPVLDPVLKMAIRVAYRDVIASGRHAVVALWLDIPPADLDVNVHPAKTELRFADPALVRGLVIGGLARALAGPAGPAALPLTTDGATGRGIFGLSLSAPRAGSRNGTGHRNWAASGMAEQQLALAAPPAARVLPEPAPSPHPLGAPVAQVLDTYVIAVAADGSLVLVDQHAAHERLTHEALRSQMLAGEVARQALLLPAVVDLPSADAARLLAQAPALARLGLEIEAFGAGALMVRALPTALGSPDPAPLLRDLADELAEHDEVLALDTRLDQVIARLACHGSIRAGRRLGAAEMDALLRRMEATPRAATCSHGRPTFLKLSRSEIERLFGRK